MNFETTLLCLLPFMRWPWSDGERSQLWTAGLLRFSASFVAQWLGFWDEHTHIIYIYIHIHIICIHIENNTRIKISALDKTKHVQQQAAASREAHWILTEAEHTRYSYEVLPRTRTYQQAEMLLTLAIGGGLALSGIWTKFESTAILRLRFKLMNSKRRLRSCFMMSCV